jgi:hypothetical protein
MTKRDLFILTIKLFGLQAIGISLFSVLPSILTVTFRQFDVVVIIWTIILISIVALICWSLIYEADKIVDLLRLSKGFTDDKIEFGNIKTTDIIKIGTFIIGGLMIVTNIPELLGLTFWTFMGDTDLEFEFDFKEKYSLTVHGLKIVIGYLLVTNVSFITGLLNRQEVK